MARLMVVDDDRKFLDILTKLLAGRGYELVAVQSGPDALQALSQQPVDLLVSDINMKPLSGIELLKLARDKFPSLPVIMLTAYGTVDTALECLRMGAFDYITKPFRVNDFVEAVERALAWDPGRAAQSDFPEIPYRLGAIVAESQSMQAVCTMIERVAPTDATVLFRGERGVGKKLAGRVIHAMSPRREGPFLVADCSDRTADELMLDLFGAVAGARPGLAEEQEGMLKRAAGGTVWLSEIAALSPEIQERLLRVFKEQTMVPLGGAQPIPVTVRILAETALDMERAVAQGNFRADLFARFAPITLEIKPVRERREDILPLVWHFCRQVLGEGVPLPRIEPDALGLMLHYVWPGNIRELESTIRALLASGPRARILGADLPEGILRSLAGAPATPAQAEDSGRAKSLRAFLMSKEANLMNQVKRKDK